jgi:peptidoglycan/xylan/chitin deacetylase (PgdA/CDA1 family)
MRIRGFGNLRRVPKWVRNRFVRGALILLYHRVAELPTDPQLLCVTPGHLAEHLDILRKEYSPIGLRELAEGYQQGNLPHRPVVVTFDDGYFDNLANAKPLLERHEIPATVFVTTGYIGRQREFWSDELERLLLQPGTLPPTVRLTINGKPYQWNLSDAASYSEEAFERHRAWNVLTKHVSGPRQALYGEIHQLMRHLPDEEQRNILDTLLAWAGIEPIVRSTHRTLSANELLSMSEGRLIDIGAHTVTHPVLSSFPPVVQRTEIRGSKARLEDILGQSVTSFAYPYGFRSDYSDETVAAVKQAGFHRACSSRQDNVWRGNDRFQLPRRIVFDWDGEEFARRLRQWLGG